MIICYVAFMGCLLAFRFTHKTCNIYPCDSGLILKQSTAKFRVIRWQEIETIWHTASRAYPYWLLRGHLYTIRCHDGYTLTLTFSNTRRSLDNQDNLVKTLEEQFTRRRLPFQFADYQAGQMLVFGPLRVNSHGITAHDKMLPWEQVADIALLKDRRLVIYKTGERPEIWLNLPAFKIPNLSILLALFKRLRSGQSAQEEGLQAISTYGTAATIVQTRRKIDPLPEGLAALAEEQGLGERRLDQNLGRSRMTSGAQLIVQLIFEALMIAIALVCGLVGLSTFLSNSFSSVIYVEFGFLSIFMIPFITIAIIHSFQQLHNYIYTFERSMILKRGQQDPVICRWEDIETAWRIPAFTLLTRRQQSIIPQRLYAYTLQLRDGTKYTLTRLNINQESLGKLIKEQVVPLQLPAAITAYQGEQTLTFGQVQVSQQGIVVDTRRLPWSQVKSVSLQGDRLVIYDITQRKPWYKLKARHIPNLFLLFALADYARTLPE